MGELINGVWRVDALLGVGGMATVFGATHQNGMRVALKILHAEFGRDAVIRERFLREAYVANRVDHPGCVKILEDGESQRGEPFLVMELLEGETVQDLWKRNKKKLPVLEALRIADGVLDTLEAFHHEGIVHRDLKPANIFVTERNEVKLLDFGVARMRDADTEHTRAGTALGTPSYMAPEQAMGLTEEVDDRADIFSVGATLYALLSGKRLHHGRSESEAFILAATQPATSLARVAPELPVEVIKLVDKALAWDIRQRYASAAEMRQEVARIAELVRAGLAQLPKERPGVPQANLPGRGAAQRQDTPAAPSDASSESRANDPNVQRLTDAFRRFEKLLPAVRQYGWEHPETASKLQLAHQGFVQALRAAPQGVFWNLDPYAFIHRGQTIWEPAPPSDTIPYQLFAVGIRTMRLANGMTEDELREITKMLLLDPSRDLPPEDDLATALWERQFEHFSYEAIHVGAEGDAGERERFYAEADSIEGLARRASDARADKAEAMAMVVSTDESAARASRDAASALALDSVTRRALVAQFAIPPERWNDRFVNVVARGFVDARQRGDVEVIGEPIAALYLELARTERALQVFVLHERFLGELETVTSHASADDQRKGRGDFVRAAFLRDTAISVLLAATDPLSEARLDPSSVVRAMTPILSEIGDASIGAAMDALSAIAHDELRELVLGYIGRVLPGHEWRVAERLLSLDVEGARPLAKVLVSSRTPEAVAALNRVASEASPLIRCELAALLAATPEQRLERLLALTEDSEAAIRVAALRTLAYHQIRSAWPLINRKVQEEGFHTLGVDERRELLEATYALHPQRGEALAIEIVQKHGLMADVALDQTRVLAADLLGRVASSDTALEAVLAGTRKRWWNGTEVRSACASAATAIGARLGRRVVVGDTE